MNMFKYRNLTYLEPINSNDFPPVLIKSPSAAVLAAFFNNVIVVVEILSPGCCLLNNSI